MSPREKRRNALFSVVPAVVVLCLALYFVPSFLYVLFVFAVCCIACSFHTSEPSLHTTEGHEPRPSLVFPTALRRWLQLKTANDAPSVGTIGRGNSGRLIKKSAKDVLDLSSKRRSESSGVFRKDEFSSSLLFSPRDILMGSYLGKPDSPLATGRFVGGTRELRERLSQPNHAVYTPNRRLSFGREPSGETGRILITPQRNFQLQYTSFSPLAGMSPSRWPGCRKNALTPRHSPAVHSPVTVKIARPDHDSARSLYNCNHLGSPVSSLPQRLGPVADPCSREAVLSVLKERRKRGVEEEDENGSFSAVPKSKRRRHDSAGSAHSAFEPLLATGTLSQLVPKPGRMKRGGNSLAVEESQLKRSRTSSVSSMCSGLTPSGTTGPVRNPIHSSYSSSRGNAQAKGLSLSPVSSPGSSRSQTPERPLKKSREEEARLPNSVTPLKSDVKPTGQVAFTGRKTPSPETPVVASASGSGGSEGKRKRKVQLVSSRRADHLSLPPPPELGYNITATDLDSEKKAALNQIKKVLEEPEVAKSVPALAMPTISLPVVSSDGASKSPGMSLGGASSTALPFTPVNDVMPAAKTSCVPVPVVSSTSAVANPLLESLKKMDSSVPGPTATTTAAEAGAVKSEQAVSSSQHGAAVGFPSAVVSVAYGQASSQDTTATALSFSLPSTPTPSLPSCVAPASVAAGVASGKSPPSAFLPVFGAGASAPPNGPAFMPVFGAGTSVTTSAPSNGPAPPTFSTVFGAGAPVTSAPSNGPAPPTFSKVFGAGAPVTSAPSNGPAPPTFSTVFGAGAPVTSAPSNGPAPPTFSTVFGAGAPVTSAPSNGPAPPTFSTVFGAGAPVTSAPSNGPAPPTFSTVFGAGAPATTSTITNGPAVPIFKPIFGSSISDQPPVTTSTSGVALSCGSSVFTGLSSTAAPVQSLFGSWNAAPVPAASTGGSFTFGATVTAVPTTALNSTTTGHLQFGVTGTTSAPPQTAPPSIFDIGQTSTSTTASAGGVGVIGVTVASASTPATAGQTAFTFGKPSSGGPSAFPAAPLAAAAKPFSFGMTGGSGVTPFSFGGASASGTPALTFGTPGPSTAPSAASAFGSAPQVPGPAPGFTFGSAPVPQPGNPAPSQSNPLQPASGGFGFGAVGTGSQFGAPSMQAPGFSFADAKDAKSTFGTSSPAFGQSTGGPAAFGSPGLCNLNPSPFGASTVPSFSIGSGSRPSGARQRLQARRQHPRKK